MADLYIVLLILERIASTASSRPTRCELFLYAHLGVAWSTCLSVCLSATKPIKLPFGRADMHEWVQGTMWVDGEMMESPAVGTTCELQPPSTSCVTDEANSCSELSATVITSTSKGSCI